MRELMSFTTQSEMIVIRSRLESEGIECQVKDELTVQIAYHYADALGGIKLFVKEIDYERAREVLKENGYNFKSIKESSSLMTRFDNYTNCIPFFKKLPSPIKLVSLISVSIGLILGMLFYFMRPEFRRELPGSQWCIDYVFHDDYPYEIEPPSSTLNALFRSCEQTLSFGERNTVYLPSDNIVNSGEYRIESDSIVISNVVGLKDTFEHSFHIRLVGDRLFLRSDKVQLRCFRLNSLF